ncbi:MAG: glycosyltransferase family 2 protein [Phascolarctobacterium sp.]|nr:glycosyltransferase family 2 protein [Phascolarctobacterium sp.]
MSSLTVLILTKNEKKHIEAVIENAKQVTKDVLIVDSGSTDGTVELAKQAGARVVYRAWDNDFSAQRNFALEQTETEWVLYLDADERLNNELVIDIKRVVSTNDNKQYSMKRKSVAFGKEFNHGVLKPDRVARLFKRTHVKWVNKVHERPECKDVLVPLKGYAEHYTYPSWEHYFQKFNQYTSIWADNAYSNGKRTSMAAAYGHAIGAFIQMAIFKGGILDGSMGLVLCCNHFSYTLTKYLKLLELQRKK